MQLWDIATRKTVGTPMRQAQLKAVAMSADGKLVLTGGGDVKARLFTTGTGELSAILDVGGLTGRGLPILAAALSPDGRTILVAGGPPDPRTVRIQGVMFGATETGEGFLCAQDAVAGRSIRWQEGAAKTFRAVAYRPDGRSVLVASDWDARILDAGTGRPFGAPLEHRGLVRAVAFSPDGRIALTAGTYGERLLYWTGWGPRIDPDFAEIRLWDASTGALRLRQPCYPACAVAFGRRGNECVAIDRSMIGATSLDLSTGKMTSPEHARDGRITVIHSSPILPGPVGCGDRTVAFSRDGASVVVGTVFRDLTREGPLERTPHWRPPGSIAMEYGGPIRAVALSPDCADRLDRG